MKDNRGFTLIELIIIMVIMGIVAVGSVVGYNILNTGSAKSTTVRISTMLDYIQLQNMTKSKTYYLVIYPDSTGKYFMRVDSVTAGGVTETELQEEPLELRIGGEITTEYSGDVTDYLLHDGLVPGRNVKDKLEICFYKETGAFKPNREGQLVTKIGISASGRSYTLRLVELTGKHYMD
ncbi:MAG: hypothetical protein K0S76_1323 [Herbinix sp.]|jgi:prepilin-type N-terminal cleavage/methylation domain-containing protein|nr:hypothetical protein [Herbinix sp.]